MTDAPAFRSLLIESLVAAAVLAFALFFILHYGNEQIGGMDGGTSASTAWHYYAGLTPYEQIHSAVPPLFLIGGKLAYVLFGVRWSSLVYITALYTALMFAIAWMVLRVAGMSLFWRAILTLSVLSATTVQIGWWWYNHTSALAGAVFISAIGAAVLVPNRRIIWLLLGVSTCILAMAKPNVAFPLLTGGYALLLIHRPARRNAAIVVSASAITTILLLFAMDMNPLRMIDTYRHATGRLSSELFQRLFVQPWTDAITHATPLFWIAALLLALQCIAAFALRNNGSAETRVFVALSLVALLGSILAMGTNFEWKEPDLAPYVASMIFVAAYVTPIISSRRLIAVLMKELAVVACVVLIATCDAEAVLRDRIRTVGEGRFYEPAGLTRIEQPDFFKGVIGGPRLVRVVNELPQVVRAFARPNDLVYFGNRIDFAYPMLRVRPAPDLPLWWGLGGEDDPRQLQADIANFKHTNFAMYVFLRRDYVGMPRELIQYLYGDEFAIFETPALTVHVPRRRLQRRK